MPTTSNFGWTTPADTDLVKDGAAAIRTLGNGIDTSFLDLKGGTTGQVLSKASNTDLDFTWSSVDPLTILDAKGDLISATAADTPARLASSGVNGDVLTVDTSTSTGLKWAAPASGSMTLLSTTSLTGATTTISSISGAYQDLLIVGYGLGGLTANGRYRIAPNETTNISNSLAMSGTPAVESITSSYIFVLGTPGYAVVRTNTSNAFSCYINNYANTSYAKPFVVYGGLAGEVGSGSSGFINTNSAISSLTFSFSAGNLNSGTVLIYGVK